MQVTDVRLVKRNSDDKCKAFGSITLDTEFVVSGIRVMQANSGNLYVAYPSRKESNGEYKDICFSLTKTLRDNVTDYVLKAYARL